MYKGADVYDKEELVSHHLTNDAGKQASQSMCYVRKYLVLVSPPHPRFTPYPNSLYESSLYDLDSHPILILPSSQQFELFVQTYPGCAVLRVDLTDEEKAARGIKAKSKFTVTKVVITREAKLAFGASNSMDSAENTNVEAYSDDGE
jgi:hypothetical protein